MSSTVLNPTEEVSSSSPLKSTNISELKQEETPENINPQLQGLNFKTKKENDDSESESEPEDESSSSEEEEEMEMFIGLSKEAILKMKQRMGTMQNGYNDHLKKEKTRQIEETKHEIEFNLGITVNDEEAEFIIKFVEENNYNLQEQLQDEGLPFLQSMKEMMEQSKQISTTTTTNNNNNNNNNNNFDFDSDSDEDWIINEKKKKAKRAAKRKNKNIGKHRNLDGSQRCGRLLLNDALKNISSQEGWSEARKKAWTNRKTSPNAYFYRFNVPGQAQRNGKWTLEEHKLFMKRVLDFGVNDSWGIFSKTIPGRVGYQCSNYWRGLVKDGNVSDPNYHFDGKKLHFKRHTKTFSISPQYRKYAITIHKDVSKIWIDLPKKHPKHPSDEYCQKVRDALSGQHINNKNGNNNNNNNKKKKRKRNSDDSDEDYECKPKRRRRNNRNNRNNHDENFTCSVNVNGCNKQDEINDNPIPEFIDIMTGQGVIKPAISPYGHVLGYDTWTKILRTSKHKNLCPFTLQKMTRRSLVKLTKDNYTSYKNKIVNITKEQTDLLASINS